MRMESAIKMELSVTSMPHEMRNNGLYFMQESQKELDFYLKVRDQIFSVISYAISYESLINLYITHKLSSLSNLTKEQSAILRYLNTDSNKNTPLQLRNMYKKLRLLENIYGLKKNNLHTKEFREFDEKVIKLRNKVVHYSHANHTKIYGQSCANICINGNQLLTNAVNSLCKTLGEDIPVYYNNYIAING